MAAVQEGEMERLASLVRDKKVFLQLPDDYIALRVRTLVTAAMGIITNELEAASLAVISKVSPPYVLPLLVARFEKGLPCLAPLSLDLIPDSKPLAGFSFLTMFMDGELLGMIDSLGGSTEPLHIEHDYSIVLLKNTEQLGVELRWSNNISHNRLLLSQSFVSDTFVAVKTRSSLPKISNYIILPAPLSHFPSSPAARNYFFWFEIGEANLPESIISELRVRQVKFTTFARDADVVVMERLEKKDIDHYSLHSNQQFVTLECLRVYLEERPHRNCPSNHTPLRETTLTLPQFRYLETVPATTLQSSYFRTLTSPVKRDWQKESNENNNEDDNEEYEGDDDDDNMDDEKDSEPADSESDERDSDEEQVQEDCWDPLEEAGFIKEVDFGYRGNELPEHRPLPIQNEEPHYNWEHSKLMGLLQNIILVKGLSTEGPQSPSPPNVNVYSIFNEKGISNESWRYLTENIVRDLLKMLQLTLLVSNVGGMVTYYSYGKGQNSLSPIGKLFGEGSICEIYLEHILELCKGAGPPIPSIVSPYHIKIEEELGLETEGGASQLLFPALVNLRKGANQVASWSLISIRKSASVPGYLILTTSWNKETHSFPSCELEWRLNETMKCYHAHVRNTGRLASFPWICSACISARMEKSIQLEPSDLNREALQEHCYVCKITNVTLAELIWIPDRQTRMDLS